MVARVHALLPASYDWSGADGKPGASEDRRERAEVQRSYYAFLNALAQSRLLQCLQASQPHSIFRRRIHCLGAPSFVFDEDYIIMFTCLSVLPSEATDEQSILWCNCLCALKVMPENCGNLSSAMPKSQARAKLVCLHRGQLARWMQCWRHCCAAPARTQSRRPGRRVCRYGGLPR